jgi:hypothetical protein
MKSLYIVASFLLISTSALASNSFEHWLASELETHQEGLASIEQEVNSDLELELIRLRIRASLSLELPLVAKGKIRPEIEFYFSK